MVPDSALLVRAEAREGLDIVDAAKELGYKATVLAYATQAGKCLIHIQVGMGLQRSITMKNRWWSRVLSEEEFALEDLFYHFF